MTWSLYQWFSRVENSTNCAVIELSILFDLWLNGAPWCFWEVFIGVANIGSSLFINIGLGVTTRAAPALNIFAVGFSSQILVLSINVYVIHWFCIQWLWRQGLKPWSGTSQLMYRAGYRPGYAIEEPTAKRLEKAHEDGRSRPGKNYRWRQWWLALPALCTCLRQSMTGLWAIYLDLFDRKDVFSDTPPAAFGSHALRMLVLLLLFLFIWHSLGSAGIIEGIYFHLNPQRPSYKVSPL